MSKFAHTRYTWLGMALADESLWGEIELPERACLIVEILEGWTTDWHPIGKEWADPILNPS